VDTFLRIHCVLMGIKFLNLLIVLNE